MTDLGTLRGDESFATAVNDAGQVVGYSQLLNNAAYHAFLWQGGAMTDLGTLSGNSYAYGINAQGQVVGYSYLPGNAAYHAFLWQGGAMTDLGTLGGGYSVARGINAQGQVAGFSYLSGNSAAHAVLWQGGAMTDLGTLGGSLGFAFGINDQGQVVGYSYLPGNSTYHAFLWQGGVMTDLNSLLSNDAGWTLTVATAVNPGGQIVGYGTDPDGLTHAFLLTPDQSPALAFPVVAPATARVLPPDYATQPGDQGRGTFPGGVTLVPPGDQTLTATDPVSGLSGNATVTVTAGPSRNGRLASAAAPAGRTVPNATDAWFTRSHRANASVSASNWEVKDLELGVSLLPAL
jgi:probable HAF family extracellular repeat protein